MKRNLLLALIVLGVGTDDFGVGTVATLYGEQ